MKKLEVLHRDGTDAGTGGGDYWQEEATVEADSMMVFGDSGVLVYQKVNRNGPLSDGVEPYRWFSYSLPMRITTIRPERVIPDAADE